MSEIAVKTEMAIAEIATPTARRVEPSEIYPSYLRADQSYYPETDGEPMAETDVHRKQMVYLLEALEDYFRADPQVYVAGNMLMYYVEGDP